MGIKERAVAGMLWLGGVRVSTQILDQAFTIVLARLLAPGDFGLIAMTVVFTRLLWLVTDMGLGRAIVQREEVDEELLSTAFWGNLAGGLIMTAVALGASHFIAAVYREPFVRPLFAAISLRFVIAGANVTQGAVLSRDLRYGPLARRNIGSVLIGGTVGVILAVAGGGVWSLVGQILATDVARTALMWTATTWRPRRIFSWARFVTLWNFGSRVLGSHIFNYVVKYADNFLIGRALGATLLGFYAFGYAMFLSPLIDVSLIVGRVAFSAFSRVQSDLSRVRAGFLLTTRYVAFFAFPVLVGLFLVAGDLVELAFGAKWLPAVPVLRVLLVAGLLNAQLTIWYAAFQALDRAGWLLTWSMISAALYVPAFYIGLRWGIVGVAAGYTASTLLLAPLQFRLLQRLLQVPLGAYLRALAPVIAGCAVMAGGVALAQAWLVARGAPLPVRLAALVTLGILLYGTGAAVLQRDLVRQLLKMLHTLRRRPAAALAGEVVT